MKHIYKLLITILSICILLNFGGVIESSVNALPDFLDASKDVSDSNVRDFSFLKNHGKEYWAVLVGIGDYPHGIPGDGDLPYSVNEVESLKEVLLHSRCWQEDHIYTLYDNNATRENMLDLFALLGTQLNDNDIFFFYFAGHGRQFQNQEFLKLHDELISDSELACQLENISSTTIIVIDACYSGGFIQELQKKDRIIVTACGKDEQTYQVADLKSGIFGYFFIQSLRALTKRVEPTFMLTKFFSEYYSMKLSQQSNNNYVIHPMISDGNIKLTKLISKHAYCDISKNIFQKIYSAQYERTMWIQN